MLPATSVLIISHANADERIFINQTYGGSNYDRAFSLVQTTDGGYALAGETASFGAGEWDFWLVKVDENGNHVWNQTYGGLPLDRARCVVQTVDGGFALAGETWSSGAGEDDCYLVKTDEFEVIPEFVRMDIVSCGNHIHYNNYNLQAKINQKIKSACE